MNQQHRPLPARQGQGAASAESLTEGGEGNAAVQDRMGTCVVLPGDSLSAIAARILGSAARWREIWELNRGAVPDPDRIFPGQRLRVPGGDAPSILDAAAEEVEAPAPEAPAAGQTYVVQPGDSLSAIAQRLCGDGGRWRELFEQNRDVVSNPSLIRVGMVLKLPAGWKGGSSPRPAPGPRDENGHSDPFQVEVFQSLSKYEGGNPALVHYDSGRVNIGKGSWTGGHIPRLMDLYVQVAVENGLEDTLYAHFGGKGRFDEIRVRFQKHGTEAWLSDAEEDAFRAVGKDKTLAQAQDRKGGEDVSRYLGQIKGFGVPWPFLDEQGAISELGAMILCHAGHQCGSPEKAYNAARGGRSREQLRGSTSEEAFCRAIGDVIVSWVAPQYRQGVKNRYNWLMATYSTGTRHKL